MRRLVTAFALCLTAASWASAQGYRANPYARSQPARASSGVSANYGGLQARTALAQFNVPQRRAAAHTGAGAPGPRRGAKPFSHVSHAPTISPYLNLYREETDEAIPNYHLFVRPQQQQIEANQHQSTQMQHLQRQLRQAAYAAPASGSSGPARYGDTAQFYSGWIR